MGGRCKSALLAWRTSVKIRKLAIKNVTSYRERTEFAFDDRINILIGPNGGGKSNVQKALAMVLSTYFIHQYEFKSNDQEVSIEPVALWNRRALERELSRFFQDERDQEIEIELVPERADLRNIEVIGTNLGRLNKRLEYWQKQYESYDPLTHVQLIAETPAFVYRIKNFKFQEPARDSAEWAFREYLRT